jgi:two-component system chemotaxis sensor kinase CheA
MVEIVNDETLCMYVQESKEHLENIETDLLEIEQQGEALDEELVNRVFRAAHSIKGGGGFLNLINIKDLAHKIENVLDMIRHRQLAPSAEVISIALEAFDHLGNLLDNVLESNGLDISPYVSRLENIVTGGLDDTEQDSLHDMRRVCHPGVDHAFEVSLFDLKQAGQNGRVFYLLEIDLIKDVHRKKLTPLDMLSRLEDAGEIIEITVSIAAVGTLEDEAILAAIPMYVLHASIIEPDLMPMVLDLDAGKIQALGEIEAVMALTAAPPLPVAVTPGEAQNKAEPAPGAQDILQKPRPAAENGEKTEKSQAGNPQAESTLRVNVALLDQLMNRAGELVLSRNQLLQAISSGSREEIMVAGQRLNLVTSELQETIMMTRMQPVGNIFSKFPRVVRELAKQLGKEIELSLEGKEVELDKTIIEGLGDPLTHLVRNAADHGIELPETRRAKGKAAAGRIVLRAHHESGQVIIEIQDDGKGIDPERIAQTAVRKGLITQEQVQAMSDSEKVKLIMLAGFSTAEQITEVSGRGVGMDVVKTNLDKLGGQVELLSVLDKGSCIRIKLPLTLAIIPSLLVLSGKQRFAIPQVNVGELLRIPAADVREQVEKMGEAEVLTLRGELIPLLQLSNVLGISRTFYDPKTGRYREDRRAKLADERLLEEARAGRGEAAETIATAAQQAAEERRQSRSSDVNIAIVQAGSSRYGLVVDKLSDNVEIVVKPLGRHLKGCEVYAGATIMGDGHLALILDINGLSHKADLRSLAETDATARMAEQLEGTQGGEKLTLLMFQNGPAEYCAVPLDTLLRVEKIKTEQVKISGGKKVIQYRGGNLQVYGLEEVASVAPLENREDLIVLVFSVAGREVGLLAAQPLDAVDLESPIDEETLRQPGIRGSAIIRGQTTLIVDLPGFMQALNPQWFADGVAPSQNPAGGGSQGEQPDNRTVLLVEDSDFFRHQVRMILEEAGLPVVAAENGQVAWEHLDARPEEIALVVTDIEMPVLDGFALAGRVRSDDRFERLPMIALTSLAGEEDMARGRQAGIDEYQIKMDKEKLLRSVWRFLRHGREEHGET